MKKLLIIVFALVTATTMFALPPPHAGNGPGTTVNGGPRLVPRLRKDIGIPESHNYRPAAPSRDVANAVAITGIVATGLRALGEFLTPEPEVIYVVPPGYKLILPEPEVKHPVPISTTPIEIIRP